MSRRTWRRTASFGPIRRVRWCASGWWRARGEPNWQGPPAGRCGCGSPRRPSRAGPTAPSSPAWPASWGCGPGTWRSPRASAAATSWCWSAVARPSRWGPGWAFLPVVGSAAAVRSGSSRPFKIVPGGADGCTVRRNLVVLVLVGTALGAWPVARPAPAAAVPAGWQRVSYGPVSWAVPAGWPVHNLAAEPGRCARLDVHAVYLGHQGERAACPARALGKTEALQVEPLGPAGQPQAVAALATHAATVAGQPARTDPSSPVTHDLVVALDRAGVALTASYGGGPALARRILATVRVKAPGGTAPGPGPAASGGRAGQASPRAATVATGVYTGKGFDTCAAPSTGTMHAWRASPYRAVGIYIGGAMRACGDGNLSASWISTVTGTGWHLAPIYVGLQAPCVFQPGLAHLSIDPSRACRPPPTPPPARAACSASAPTRPSTSTWRPTTAASRAACGRCSASSAPGPASCTAAATAPGSTPAPPPA